MRNWILVAVILIVVGLIGAGVTFGNGDFSFGTVKVNKKEIADIGGVSEIRLDTGSTDVEVVPGDSDRLTAELSGRASKKYADKLELRLERDGDRLTVVSKQSTGFTIGINILDVDLRIELPEREYRELALDSGSGNADLRGIKAKTIALDVGSGNVQLRDSKGDEISVGTGSGNIGIASLTGRVLTVHTSSGNIEANAIEAEQLKADTGSGNIRLVDAEGELAADTGSGNIRIDLEAIRRPMTLETGSGDIAIKARREPESAKIHFTTGSGSLSSDWKDDTDRGGKRLEVDGDETLLFGDGATVISAETGSGNFSLEHR